MRLLVYDIQGKIFVKARHLKRQSASGVKILARRPETAKLSVVAQRSEQIKAYDCY